MNVSISRRADPPVLADLHGDCATHLDAAPA